MQINTKYLKSKLNKNNNKTVTQNNLGTALILTFNFQNFNY